MWSTKINSTRMHSNRMRTTRSLTASRCREGRACMVGCACVAGVRVWQRGGACTGGMRATHAPSPPPWTEWQTRVKTLSLRAVKISGLRRNYPTLIHNMHVVCAQFPSVLHNVYGSSPKEDSIIRRQNYRMKSFKVEAKIRTTFL